MQTSFSLREALVATILLSPAIINGMALPWNNGFKTLAVRNLLDGGLVDAIFHEIRADKATTTGAAPTGAAPTGDAPTGTPTGTAGADGAGCSAPAPTGTQAAKQGSGSSGDDSAEEKRAGTSGISNAPTRSHSFIRDLISDSDRIATTTSKGAKPTGTEAASGGCGGGAAPTGTANGEAPSGTPPSGTAPAGTAAEQAAPTGTAAAGAQSNDN